MLPLIDPWAGEETDEEMERRLREEISSRTAAHTTDDAGFDDTIASLAGPSQPVELGAPVAQEQPAAPAPIQAPRPTPSAQAAPGAAAPQPDPYGAELAGLREQLSAAAAPGERRRRIVRGMLMGLQRQTPEQIQSALGPSPRDRQAAIMERMTQLRAAQGEARQRTLQQFAEQQRREREATQRQTNADRDFALRERGVASLEGHRAAQTELGRGRLELQEGTQEWREEQADLNRAAAETRARIIAGQRVGTGGGVPQPGGEGSGLDVGGYTDAPIVQAMVDNRPEIREMAARIAQEQRAQGQEVDEQAIAWDIASNQFRAMSRKNQDMVRRQYAAPESTGAEARSETRATEQRATRVRQYGQDVQARTEWDRSVRGAMQAMQGASDADIRMAQQWLQGGMRQAVTELSPGARQLAQRLARLQNVLLRERSGAAVTDQEFARLRSELGANWYQSPDSMRAALQEMGASSQEMANALAATYGPEVVQAYQSNLQAAGGAPAGGGVSVGDTITIGGRTIRVQSQAQADRINRARGGQQ
jgi:hypothetical protein